MGKEFELEEVQHKINYLFDLIAKRDEILKVYGKSIIQLCKNNNLGAYHLLSRYKKKV